MAVRYVRLLCAKQMIVSDGGASAAAHWLCGANLPCGGERVGVPTLTTNSYQDLFSIYTNIARTVDNAYIYIYTFAAGSYGARGNIGCRTLTTSHPYMSNPYYIYKLRVRVWVRVSAYRQDVNVQFSVTHTRSTHILFCMSQQSAHRNRIQHEMFSFNWSSFPFVCDRPLLCYQSRWLSIHFIYLFNFFSS